MTYSIDFRRKVLKESFSDEETAQYFGIGIANLTRWRAYLEPKLTRNKPAGSESARNWSSFKTVNNQL